jgi:hypothetical protein
LERHLAAAKGGPRENVSVGDEAGFARAGHDGAPATGRESAQLRQAAPSDGPTATNQWVLADLRGARHFVAGRPGVSPVPGGEALDALDVVVGRGTHRGPVERADSGSGGNLTEEPSSETFTIVCNQAELTIGGNTNSAYMAGHCAHLIVKGSHNKVVAATRTPSTPMGQGNQVIYHTGTPPISVGGTENLVKKG